MTTTEHLQKIKAECERLLTLYETGKSFALSGFTEKQSMAGWRSTIAAIDGFVIICRMNNYMEVLNPSMTMAASFTEAQDAIKQILAAWPTKLLT
jgi:hypothetical protein